MDYGRYERIAVKADGKILRVTLNNPDKRNITNDFVTAEIANVFTDAALDPDVHVVVLTGAGKAFCGGGDFAQMKRKADNPRQYYPGIFGSRRLVFSILDCPKPTIARLNGDAMGLGATMALLCDIVIANEDAKIADPHVNVGLVAGDGGALIWPLLIGYARAKRHILGAEPISAREAAEIGLIAFAVPLSELDALTEEWANKFANGAVQSICSTKMTMNVPLRQAAHALLDVGLAYEGLSNITKDHQEAVTAFLEKRKPTFTGE